MTLTDWLGGLAALGLLAYLIVALIRAEDL